MFSFGKGRLSRRIFLSLFLACGSLLLIGSLISYNLVKTTLNRHLEEDLALMVADSRQLVETAASLAIRNYLQGIVAANLAMAAHWHEQARAGTITVERAQERARDLLLVQQVGDSGYCYVINSQGTILVHPKEPLLGTDIAEFSFIKKQIESKHGLLRYQWQNPDDERARRKVLYMDYFAPWDWIISVSAYRSELTSLLESSDFAPSLIQLGLDREEFSFILDQSGRILAHPYHTGTIAELPAAEADLMRSLLARKEGEISYPLTIHPGTPSTEHIILFSTIEEYGWLVAATISPEPYFAPLKTIRRVTLTILAVSTAVIALVSFFLSRTITAPLRQLLNRFAGADDLSIQPLRQTAANEIESLAGAFSSYIERLEDTNSKLEALWQQQYAMSIDLKIFKEIFESSPDGMVITDADGDIEQVNPAFQKITGYSAVEVIGSNPRILKSGHHPDSFYQDMWDTIQHQGFWSGKIWNKRKNGDVYPEFLTILTIYAADGTISHYAAIFKDLRTIIEQEEKIRFLAFHDPLTALPNRLLVFDRLQQSLSVCKRHGGETVCMIIDLDNFKSINDSLGHASGDELLNLVAERITAEIRDEDTLGRMGGDEFILIYRDDNPGRESAVSLIKRLFHATEEPFVLNEQHIYLSVSIGIATFPGDGTTTEDLLKRADLALLGAKSLAGNSYQFFNPDMELTVKKKLHYLARIRKALTLREFLPFYQPKVDLVSGRVVGIEALARWQSGDKLISPADFIPVAEQSGMIVPLAEQIYRQAFHDLKVLREKGFHLTLALNLSPAQLRVETFPELLQQMLAVNGLSSSAVELEITETIMMENISQIRKTIDRLVRDGFTLAIDDFGTGYSSISYLKQFPLSTLKIDRSFVKGIGRNTDDERLIETIVLMARQFNLTIVAEGIEQQSQELFLRELTCNQGQGFLYGRPMAFETLQDWLNTNLAGT